MEEGAGDPGCDGDQFPLPANTSPAVAWESSGKFTARPFANERGSFFAGCDAGNSGSSRRG